MSDSRRGGEREQTTAGASSASPSSATQRIAEIEARLSAATPGPWALFDGDVRCDTAIIARVWDAENLPGLEEDDYDEVQVEGRANSRLIAKDVPESAAMRGDK